MGHFERVRYPDGQISAKWIPGKYDDNPLAHKNYTIKERINSYEDLFYICAIADVLHHRGTIGLYDLFIPCLFGQRSDRRFNEDQSFDLKLITDLINHCGFNEVKILDPHSDVSMALLDDVVKVSSFPYVQDSVMDIRQKMCDEGLSPGFEDIILISPDAGAYKKVFEYGASLRMPVVGAMKHRDPDGTISMSFTHDVKGKDCLIVDDLCDGGATFVSLAEVLKLQGARKVYLYVTHGIFSKGFEKLYRDISHIYCTNSYRDVMTDEFKTPGRDQGTWETATDFITQYKVI